MPNVEVSPAPEDGMGSPADGSGHEATGDGPQLATSRDKAILAFFWVWAALLLIATLAHLFGWNGVLDLLDVKHWFSK